MHPMCTNGIDELKGPPKAGGDGRIVCVVVIELLRSVSSRLLLQDLSFGAFSALRNSQRRRSTPRALRRHKTLCLPRRVLASSCRRPAIDVRARASVQLVAKSSPCRAHASRSDGATQKVHESEDVRELRRASKQLHIFAPRHVGFLSRVSEVPL